MMTKEEIGQILTQILSVSEETFSNYDNNDSNTDNDYHINKGNNMNQ